MDDPPFSPHPALVVIEGTLGIFRKFKYSERYVMVVSPGLLKIYRRNPSAGGAAAMVAPKITASLKTMNWSLSGSSTRCFTLDTGRQIVVLRASNEAERNQWTRALELERSILPCITVGVARTKMPWAKELGPYRLATAAIGDGGFGSVCQGFHIESHRRVAIKIVPLQGRRPVLVSTVEDEINAMAALRHPNVVQLLDAIHDTSEQQIYLVMELATGGELFAHLYDAVRFGEVRVHIIGHARNNM